MSNKLFQLVDIQLPGRSAFGLTHNRKATYKLGYLYPNLCLPVSPGDAFKCSTENFMLIEKKFSVEFLQNEYAGAISGESGEVRKFQLTRVAMDLQPAR